MISSTQKARSCNNCAKRKLKCDREQPCSRCKTHGIPCITPATSKLARGRNGGRRKADADLSRRIQRLEGLLNQVLEVTATESPRPLIDESTPVNPASIPTDGANENSFRSKPSSDRHLASSVWSSLCEDIHDLREYLYESSGEDEVTAGSDQNRDDQHLNDSPFCDFPLLNIEPQTQRTKAVDLRSQPQLDLLFRHFVSNVDPVVKILHPSILQSVRFLDNGTSDNRDLSALRCAVLFASATSLSSPECLRLLSQQKTTLVSALRHDTEVAMAKADITTSGAIALLQALVLYLFALRSNDSSRRMWMLTSLAVRFANSIDLHREARGADYLPTFSIFDAEIRRRLWWLILLLDRVASFDRASEPMISYHSCNTRLPLNINDSDIAPGTTMVPGERVEFTDVTLSLICHSIFDVEKRLNFVSAIDTGKPSDTWWLDRRQMVVDCEQRLMMYLRYCDSNVPLQRYTTMVAKILVAILWLSVYRPLQRHPQLNAMPVTPPEGLLQLAMRVIEASIAFENDPDTQNFQWMSSIWVQWHALVVMIAELYVQVEGPIVDRAWVLLGEVFDNIGRRIPDTNHGRLWKSIKKMMQRAKSIRMGHLAAGFQVHQLQNSHQAAGPIADSNDWRPYQASPGDYTFTDAESAFPTEQHSSVAQMQAPISFPDMNLWQTDWSLTDVGSTWETGQHTWAHWEAFVDDYQGMGSFL